MKSSPYGICLNDVLQARHRIRGIACHTPLKPSFSLQQQLNRQVWLKLENMQPTGAFKIRGAANSLLSLTPEAREKGVITTSSGNHGRALAYLAQQLGIPAVVCMAEIAPKQKIANIRDLGAEVIISGKDQGEATERAGQIARERDLTFVPAFDDPDIIAGQGTIALEIFEDLPDVDTLVVQVSGGGLMSGICIAARAIKPDIRILGVTSEHGAAIYESIKAGKVVEVDEPLSIADALPGPIPLDNRYTYPICKDMVDEIIKVSDDEIKEAMIHAFYRERLILEGAGAAGIALLQQIDPEKLGDRVAVVCTGDNIDPARYLELVKLN